MLLSEQLLKKQQQMQQRMLIMFVQLNVGHTVAIKIKIVGLKTIETPYVRC